MHHVIVEVGRALEILVNSRPDLSGGNQNVLNFCFIYQKTLLIIVHLSCPVRKPHHFGGVGLASIIVQLFDDILDLRKTLVISTLEER